MSDAVSLLDKVKGWFAALNKREQRLIVGTLFGAPLFVFIQLIFLPGLTEQTALERQVHQLEQDNTILQSQVLEMSLLAEKDPDADNRKKLEQLQQEIARFDQRLQENLSGLVAPAQMPGLLRSMLKQRAGLTLISMENAQPQAISLAPMPQQGEAKERTALPEVVLYRHPLHLELQGRYLDVLAYLQDVRKLPQRVFWHGLHIEMGEGYPQARIQVDVYTLSLEKGWISG
ncbi:type 4a pilus biogenesis protein PilO [Desulfuromonas acetoxidans]|uniref:MSHA biogenesis protein MshJ n=1 Tax=Desulfuromonas acetoxidans (strain DSM 684 / 11070) TaxID=281689 RepID=Q1K1Y8_DESA6|nr:type 4a pilus biogenesis protein PilO [Desulfuromonas acetoxidans]EAT16651.1 conserved hypothetical protein [Desulfuromonas acetoxidans DSM 684]MBF0646474.1 type 4a pilus biogenesis protein PilO [Desulfuromonas acetoxidans]NVD24762.1 type 4a pilus biogenesis protein PilO [Desulfuromonas acetoxidans]NVE16807.1 type 4a pilus biogenesis protein PilO [Desulfuromonas acetoxidans]